MPVEGPDPNGHCWPRCVWFRCGKRALLIRGNEYWCKWLNEPCAGPSCSYAYCARGKLLPENRCGLVVRRITRDKITPEDFKLDIKLKGRLAKKLGEEDII